MPAITINRITTRDARFQLKPGEGADAVHTAPQYVYAVAQLHTDQPYIGIGLAFTLGGGNELVCRAIEALFLEYIPHLRDYFRHPAIVAEGVYRTPEIPGCSADLKEEIV